MVKISVDDAKNQLEELIHKVLFGEEVYIYLSDDKTVRITIAEQKKKPRKAGCLKGMIGIKDGFNDIPEEFDGYMI